MKNKLIKHLENILIEKLDVLNADISSLIESRNNDTKSSAGDKYETGREMTQIELNKLEAQLIKTKLLLSELLKADALKSNTSIDFGALVYTDKENYFLTIPFGKVNLEDEEFFVISMASPIGSLLKGKKIGDVISFNGRDIKIEKIN